MTVDEGHEPSEVFGRHPPPPCFLAEHTLNHQRIAIHHRVLQQMQRQHRHLLVFSAIRSDFAPCANKNEVVGAVPVLDDIESLLNLTSQLSKPEIAAQEDRPTGLAQLDKRLIGGVLEIIAREASQDGVRLGGAQPSRRSVLHHVVVFLGHEVPVDGTPQYGVQIGIDMRLSGVGVVEALLVDGLEPGQQLEA